jgi:Carbon-nitrogen hydrolase
MAGFSLTVALAQIAPVWLDRAAMLAKVNSYVEQAVRQGCGLVAFGEALVPGYPFWLELTDGARFNSPSGRRSSPSTGPKRFNRARDILMKFVRRRRGIGSPSIWAAWSAPQTVERTACTVRSCLSIRKGR